MNEAIKTAMLERARKDINTTDESVWDVLEALFNDAYDLGYGKGYDRGVMDTGANR